jgi:hypothetical protein
MAEQEEVQEERKKGKGKLIALLAVIGAILAFFKLRGRHASEEEEEE